MTKEELKQEAEQDAGNVSGFDLLTTLMVTKNKTDAYKLGRYDGYLASAEPREKRIAALERNVAYYAERAKHAELAGRDIVLENKDLGKRCLQLQKDKGELTDENERLKGNLELWESGACRATNLDKCGVVKELEAQIEKMKNCKNCKKLKKEKDGLLICTVGSFYTNTFGKNCDKWEIKEE